MSHLPRDLLEGLHNAARDRLKRKARFRVHVDGRAYPIVRLWGDGFSVDAEDAPHLRGLVDIYDGARHMYECLIVCSSEEGHERVFEFKRNTTADGRAPLDYERDANAPIALLGRSLRPV